MGELEMESLSHSGAAVLDHMDAFWVLTLISLGAVPLALALRSVKLGGPAPVAH